MPLGTAEERGMTKWREHIHGEDQHQQQKDDDEDGVSGEAVHKLSSTSSDCYDLPWCMPPIRRWTFFKYFPFCPTFVMDAKHSQTTDDLEANGGSGIANEAAEVSTVNVESPV